MKPRISMYFILSYLVILSLTNISPCSASPIALPPLPYGMDALEPYITQRTLSFHYEKHHAAYVKKTNELLDEEKNQDLKVKSLEEIIMVTAKDSARKKLFNQAAQVWNHTFYWRSMKMGGGGEPTGPLLDKIKADFGNYDAFKKEFIKTGKELFGSGWVWLVLDQGHLKIIGTPDAENPLTKDQRPLLNCDVWEHAYYLDYQNRRDDYVTVFLDHLVNWEFAEQNLQGTEQI